MTLELASPLLITTPNQREDLSALDRFNVHRTLTRRVFSDSGFELMTRQPQIRYLGYRDHTRGKTLSFERFNVHQPLYNASFHEHSTSNSCHDGRAGSSSFVTPDKKAKCRHSRQTKKL
ncbi:hypothetical protein TNCV_4606461 [Trichonephila clavipes]|nr:hypothetical protein TNCV_4606461 [Trichonephila clavipes]